MARDVTQLDAGWAWSVYEPGAAGAPAWSRSLAAHLYRRAGFAATSRQLDEAIALGPAKAIDQLFSPGQGEADRARQDTFQREMALMNQTMMGGDASQQLSAWWLYRMLVTPHQLLEKATLFWHGHFATSAAKVDDAGLMIQQNELLRNEALGKFMPMVQAISRDPAMLVWLDAAANRRIRPNENYARELMELFCLGEGQYTEQDIKQVARAFTGWELRSDRFFFNSYQHDEGEKRFLGRSGNFDGDDAVRIVLDQPAAARFLAGKLLRYYVCEEPALPEALVEPLARDLRASDFDLGRAWHRIVSSNLFFSEHAIGHKVRSPVELGVGLLRAFEARTDMTALAGALARLGQGVFYPPNVKGWDGGRTWINSSTLLGRANLVRELVFNGTTHYAAGPNLAAVADQAGVEQAEAVVAWLLELLVAVPVAQAARQPLVDLMRSGQGDRSRRIATVIAAIGALPEFQLT